MKFLCVSALLVASAAASSSSSSSDFIVNVGKLAFLQDVNVPTAWQSAEQAKRCFASIEKAKVLTAAHLTVPLDSSDVETFTCPELKGLCAACNSCSHFTNGKSPSATEKNCVCLMSNPAATLTLGSKDDCVIIPSNVFSLTETVEGGSGDDCFISLGTGSGARFDGEAGDDIVLILNNGVDDVTVLHSIVGGDGQDCIYLADTIHYASGGDDDDIVFVDTYAGPLEGYEAIFGDGGDDLIIVKAVEPNDGTLNIFGDAQGPVAYYGDDVLRVKGGAFLVEGDLGDDDIEIESGGYGGVVYGDDYYFVNPSYGNDKIVVKKHAIVNNIFGAGGNDYIYIGSFVNVVYGGDDEDNIVVAPHVHANNIFGNDGDDTVVVHGKVANVYLGDGNDEFLLTEDAHIEYVYGYNGDDHIVIHGDAYNVAGNDDDDKIEILEQGNAHNVIPGEGENKVIVGSDGFAFYIDGYGPVGGIDHVEVKSGGTVGYVYGGLMDDEFDVSGTVLRGVFGGMGNDRFFISSDASVGNVAGGPGDDYLHVETTAVRDIDANEDDDTCVLASNVQALHCENVYAISSSS